MTTIEIPDEMIKEIDSIRVENPELGYEDVNEFIREAIRDKFLILRDTGIMVIP